ncbi:DoxX family protein [Mucilaginibacter sp. KACC 22773]|uniref:DoxX family protein n=1 Tax=Mucilaginibacter sp. KACC 22773 TaxID=3025671 RepID=UPI0023658D80|nr:DoxX family protein [Mucilaginibacter sp. KACC 22773]WDF81130.1 DoxX family protein [Mucilaginibacter sp. KACC 22773]
MKELLKANQQRLTDSALLIARVVIAGMMLNHGLPKVPMLLNGPVKFFTVFGMSPSVSLTLTLFAQVVCSALVLFGIVTRLALVPLIATMLVALVVIHRGEPFARMEPALHFLLVYIVLFLTGPGKYAVDRLIQRANHPDRS